MSNPWLWIGTGTVLCLGGMGLFHRNAFEENKKVALPLVVIVAGIILISIGMAKQLHLID